MLKYLKRAIHQRIFFSLGLLFLVPMAWKIGKISWQQQAQSGYVETTCKIIKNQSLESGDKLHLNLEYSYVFQNISYTGSRYILGLDHFTNQNRSGAKQFIKDAPPGTDVVCYVNPETPTDAVIRKGHAYKTYEVWVYLLFLLAFMWGFLISIFAPEKAVKMFVPADPS